jgi:hypothetical protein
MRPKAMDQKQMNTLLEDWWRGRDAPPAVRTPLAVALSGLVWPGLGQIYNRQFKKGLAFIALAGVSGVGFLLGAGRRFVRALPPSFQDIDIDRAITIADEVLNQGGGWLVPAAVLLMLTWVVSIVDAYLGSRVRKETRPHDLGTPT